MILRWVCVVLFAVAGCGGGKEKPGAPGSDPAATSGSGTAGIAACQALVRALDGMEACAPSPAEREMAKRMYGVLRNQNASTEPLGEGELQPRVELCLDYLDSIAGSLRWQKCPYTVPPPELAWIAALNGRRTPVPAGADAESRKALEYAANVRDQACACKDLPCAEAALRGFDAPDLPSLPPGAPAAVKDAGSRMIDEATRCRRVLNDAANYRGDVPPSDPAGAQRMLDHLGPPPGGAP